MSPMPGIFCSVEFIVLFISPAMANVWPLCSSSSVSVRRVLSAGNAEAVEHDGVGEVERADLRPHLEVHAVAVDDRREVQADAEFLVLDGDRHVAAAALRDRHRELAAGEEAGFLAALGDEVRLGEALEQALRLQRLDHGAEVVLLVEEEQVQEVAERELAGRCVTSLPKSLLAFDTSGREAGRRELLRRRRGRRVLDAGRAGEERRRRARSSRCGSLRRSGRAAAPGCSARRR